MQAFARQRGALGSAPAAGAAVTGAAASAGPSASLHLASASSAAAAHGAAPAAVGAAGAAATGSAPQTGRAAAVAAFADDAVRARIIPEQAKAELLGLLDSSWSTGEAAREAVLAFLGLHMGTMGLTVAQYQHHVAGACSSGLRSVAYCSGWLEGVRSSGQAIALKDLTCQQRVVLRCSEADGRWRVAVGLEEGGGVCMHLPHGAACTRRAGGARRKTEALARSNVIAAAASSAHRAPLTEVQRNAGFQTGVAASSSTVSRAVRKRTAMLVQAGARGAVHYLQELVDGDHDTRVVLTVRDVSGALGRGEQAMVQIAFRPRQIERAAADGEAGGTAGDAADGATDGAASAGVAPDMESVLAAVEEATANALAHNGATMVDVFKLHGFDTDAVDDDNVSDSGAVDGDDGSGSSRTADGGDEDESDEDDENEGGAGLELVDGSGNGLDGAFIAVMQDAFLDTEADSTSAGLDAPHRGASLEHRASPALSGVPLHSAAPLGGALHEGAASAQRVGVEERPPPVGAASAVRHGALGGVPPVAPRVGVGAASLRAPARAAAHYDAVPVVDADEVLRIAQRQHVPLQLVAVLVEPGVARRLQQLPVATSFAADFSYFRSKGLHDKLIIGIVAMSVGLCKLTVPVRVTMYAGNESQDAWEHLVNGVVEPVARSLANACSSQRTDGFPRGGGLGIVFWVDGEKGASNAVHAALDALPGVCRRFVVMGRCAKHIERNLRSTLGKVEFAAAFSADARLFWDLVDAPDEATFNVRLAGIRRSSERGYAAVVRVNNLQGDPTRVGAEWSRMWFKRQGVLTFNTRTSNLVEIQFQALLVLGARMACSFVQAMEIAVAFVHAAARRVTAAVERARRANSVVLPDAYTLYQQQLNLARGVGGGFAYLVEWVNVNFGVAHVVSALGEKRLVDLRAPHVCQCDAVDGIPCRHRLATKADGEQRLRRARPQAMSSDVSRLLADTAAAATSGSAEALAKCLRVAGGALSAIDVSSADKTALAALLTYVAQRAVGNADVQLALPERAPVPAAQPPHGECVFFEACLQDIRFFWTHEFAVQHLVSNFGDNRFAQLRGNGRIPSIEEYVRRLDAYDEVDFGVEVLVDEARITRGRPSVNARKERRSCKRCGGEGHNARTCADPVPGYQHVRKRKRTVRREEAAREEAARASAAAAQASSAAPRMSCAAQLTQVSAVAPLAPQAAPLAPQVVPLAPGASDAVAHAAAAPQRMQRLCRNCGLGGHYAKTCKAPCARCGQVGHGAASCLQA